MSRNPFVEANHMLMARTKIAKVVVIRPGALGDVLAVRSVLRFFRDVFPGVELSLVAPGERGRFFERDGWADRVFDYDRAAFSWLFSDADDEPPVSLRAAFGASDIVVAYQDFAAPDSMRRFERKLERLAPASGRVFCPARPPAGHEQSIGSWLLHAAYGFCRRYELMRAEGEHEQSRWRDACVTVERHAFPGLERPYLVMHPGSGGKGKNWPLENFAALANMLLQGGRGGRLLVTAGEADGDSGKRLADAVPGALLLENAGLESLAAVLAYSRLYIGNDSGVSHLASAVCGREGERPERVVLFGPSNPEVWGPPGAVVLPAGKAMDELPAAAAFSRIRGLWPDFP